MLIHIVAVLVAVLAVMLAKHRRKRAYRAYLGGQIDLSIDLGTLAGNTLVSGTTSDTVEEAAWLTTVVCSWTMDQLTPGNDVGPIMVGVAHTDYTDAEIEAWIENVESWSQGDLVAQEVAKRKIRRVGVFGTEGASDAQSILALRDGAMIRTKCGWLLNTGDGVDFWAYNMGSGAIATTTPNLHIQGKANMWPQ